MSSLSKLNTRAPLDRSPKKNWVENAGGLPMYIRRIANHLHAEKGMTISRAIAVAVNAVNRMCGTGDLNWKGVQQVNAGSRAEACAAVADWERKKAGARVSKGVLGRKWSDEEYIDYLVNEVKIHKNCGCSRKRRKKKMKMQRGYEVEKRFFSQEERKKVTTYPGTTKFPVTDQASFSDAWGLRGNSSIPKEKIESWLRGLAKRNGYSIPGEVEKTRVNNPFWDGDGLNGVGQPRDHRGQWVRLPGRSKLAKVGIWEMNDGGFGVYESTSPTGKPRSPAKTYKSYGAAAKDAAKKVAQDRPDRSGYVEGGYREAEQALHRGEGFKGAKRAVTRGVRAGNRAEAKYQAEQTRGKKLGGGLKVGSRVTLDPEKVRNKAFKGKVAEVLEVRGDNLVIIFPNGDRRLIRRDMVIIQKSHILDDEFEELEKEINAEINTDLITFDAIAKIEEINDDQQMVFGWCSIAKHKDGTVEVDKQGDVLEDIDQMEKVAYDFVLNSRDGGEMHVRKGVSTLVESFVSTPEKWEAMGIPEGVLPIGWWVGFHVNDTEVWKAVKSGKYRMFSVHGSGTRKALD